MAESETETIIIIIGIYGLKFLTDGKPGYTGSPSLGIDPHVLGEGLRLCYYVSDFRLRLAFLFTSSKTCVLSIHFKIYSDLANGH